MKPNIIDAISKQIIVADGAMGTELQRAGLEPGACGEVWNVERPQEVLAIHRAYVEAGAQLITTNSFRANRAALSYYGLEARVEEFNRAAVNLARKAAGDNLVVMGSIGPLGDVSIKDGFDIFSEQARALILAGVDAVIIETMTSTDELEMAVRAARCAGAPFIIATMAFDKVSDGYKTLMGVEVEQAVAAMARAGADVFGCNCGAAMAMDDYRRVVEMMRALSDKPIIAQPNAGKPHMVEGKILYRQTPEAMAEKAERLIKAGAQIIGGCCGTTPEHIVKVSTACVSGWV